MTEDSPIDCTRRAVLRGTAVAPLALAGCLGGGNDSEDDENVPDPIALSGGKADDRGGMIIGEHYGPNGQIFYDDNSPSGHDNPAWFHTLVAGLFPYHFEKRNEGWTADAIYVTDYSRVDYEVRVPRDTPVISSHTAADTFGDARELTYVAGSEVHGGMGPELIPFGDGADADSFVDEYGGRQVAFEDVDKDLLAEIR